MTEHDELRLSLGSYLAGALGPIERAETDEHLRHCYACRAEVVELAALPGLLRRLGPESFGVGPRDSEPSVAGLLDVGSSLAPELLSGVLERARRIGVQSRRRRRRWLIATSVVTLAAAAFLIVPGVSPAPGTTYPLHAQGASALSGEVTLIPKPWGTEVSLSLRGLPARASCQAVVTGIDGRRTTIGDWSATSDHVVRVDVATALPPAQLASLSIETVSGRPLLALTLH